MCSSKMFRSSVTKLSSVNVRDSMLSKFEKLSKLDWHDLYLLEQETIEYNYDWFMSKKYLEKLKTHA